MHVGTVLGPCTKIESFVSAEVGGHVGDTGPYSEVRNSKYAIGGAQIIAYCSF